ncbi:MAG: hypothetical protein Q8934_10845 [Bacillota bacterium]|nr:hypothetical protein [Bacillota bacterium]
MRNFQEYTKDDETGMIMWSTKTKNLVDLDIIQYSKKEFIVFLDGKEKANFNNIKDAEKYAQKYL